MELIKLPRHFEQNLKLIEEFSVDSKKLKIVKVDIPFASWLPNLKKLTRKSLLFSSRIWKTFWRMKKTRRSAFEALQLKASIKEILGLEEEAAKIYEEADSIQCEREWNEKTS